MKSSIKRSLFALVFAVLGTLSLGVSAQPYPNKPVRLVVPYPAGSLTDVVTRLLATSLSERLGQSIVIDNRTGAGGIVAMKSVQQASPDGYTLGLIVSSNIVQPWLMKVMPFDARKDFVPVSMLYSFDLVMTVTPDFPATDFNSFLTYAKANPGKINFGSSGVGTTTHLAAELVKQSFGLDLVHIPFRGSPEVYAAMQGGSVQLYFDGAGTATPHIDGGRVRALAVTGAARNPNLPKVPAIAESAPGFNVVAWAGLAAPLGTPPEVAERLSTALRAVFESPDVRKRLAQLGVAAGGGTAAEFATFMNVEYEKWGKAIRAAGITPQ